MDPWCSPSLHIRAVLAHLQLLTSFPRAERVRYQVSRVRVGDGVLLLWFAWNLNFGRGVRWFKAQGEFLVSMGGRRTPRRGRGHVGRRDQSAQPYGSLVSGHAHFLPGCPWLTSGPCFSWLPRRWAREGGGTRGGVRILGTLWRGGQHMQMTQWRHNGNTRHIHIDRTKKSSRPLHKYTENISKCTTWLDICISNASMQPFARVPAKSRVWIVQCPITVNTLYVHTANVS